MSTASCKLTMPDQADLYGHIIANAPFAERMVGPNSHTGKSLVICGAGPSLATYADALPAADEVWACNSALPYLMARGAGVTHGFTIDQGRAMLGAVEWARAFPVDYYVASSAHPDLVQHLRASGQPLTFFHSFLGIPDPVGWTPPVPGLAFEMFLYQTKYPASVQVGHGLNSVPRAICLALFMDFTSITVYGADCACAPDAAPMPPMDGPDYEPWLRSLQLYADGRSLHDAFGADENMAEGVIDGRRWHTRADMIVSAIHLLELQRANPGRIVLVGDTLPNAIADKDAAWMDNMPKLSGVGEVSGFGVAHPAPEPEPDPAPAAPGALMRLVLGGVGHVSPPPDTVTSENPPSAANERQAV